MAEIWMVRAGEGAAYAEEFRVDGLVAIGWAPAGRLAENLSRKEIEEAIAKGYPDMTPGQVASAASTVRRFLRDIKVGDPVATYDPATRQYLLGSVLSEADWRAGHALPRYRRVQWNQCVPRDVLSASARNTLGSIQTLFLINQETSTELRQKSVALDTAEPSVAEAPQGDSTGAGARGEGDALVYAELVQKSADFIEDRIARLHWRDVQALVAGILRAMGYRTKVSEGGSDRGVDVFASRDGLGLEEPRIFVEVKHRGKQMGAQDIRAFLGGRKAGDRCLYVSTGGFTKDARYEAERSAIPIQLLTLTDFRQLLVEHYDRLDSTAAALVPLARLYWPIGR